VNAISRFSFHLTFSISLEKEYHIKDQNIIHQKSIHRKVVIQTIMVLDVITQLFITASITRNNANAVQSLKRLSHSNIKTSLLGAQNCLNKAKTATGSVEDIIDQNSIVTSSGIGSHII